jgi:hypothetical protein
LPDFTVGIAHWGAVALCLAAQGTANEPFIEDEDLSDCAARWAAIWRARQNLGVDENHAQLLAKVAGEDLGIREGRKDNNSLEGIGPAA